MLDLSTYVTKILSPEDKPLFEEASQCAASGSLRAAYVMIWLACAESLKRRFREAQKRDGAAGIIVGDFEQKEKDQKAIDKFLLGKAKDYGFLTDTAHSQLEHVYDMRCVYGHPYEAAPTHEQVVHAASLVIGHVLSHPVRLKHGFVQPLLSSLLNEKSYLDDTQEAVKIFVDEILPRIDESILPWMLDKYWSELEKISLDASQSIFLRRGVWFTREVLSAKGTSLLTPEQWHAKAGACPDTLIRLIRFGNAFTGMGLLAQDTLVGKVIELSQSGRPSHLRCFEPLLTEGGLTERQALRIQEHIDTLDVKGLSSCGLTTKTCFNRIISALKSHTWPLQNPAIKFVVSNGPDQASELSSEQLIQLGRNILQAADGNAGSCIGFLSDLKNDSSPWPDDLLRGIAYECFTNEIDQIRFKNSYLEVVLGILSSRGDEFAGVIANEVAASIRRGKIKYEWRGRTQFNEVAVVIRLHSWGKDLAEALDEIAARLPKDDEHG